ncbi:MAG: tRNA dihydrouridine synthase DusB [Candidatus Kryptoniota bacterium]
MEISLGKYLLNKPIALAPMEDVTDLPFRLLCKEFGADIVYTEFISSEGLTRAARKSIDKLLISDLERPVGIQIFGSDSDVMADAARIAEDAGADFIDINAGCWVPKVASRGAGAGLMRDLKTLEAIIQQVRKAVKIPVTLKTRLGWDSNSITIFDVADICAEAGLSALAIHARTRDQRHDGEANWDWIRKVKEVAKLPIIGNGDIREPADAIEMFEFTKCDGVMIARGAINNPWIFRQIKSLMNGKLPVKPSLEERINICLRHIEMEIELKGEKRGILEFRKYYHGYFHGLPNASILRSKLVRLNSLAEIRETLHSAASIIPDDYDVTLSKTR